MVNPGSSAHRHQARSKAHPTRTHYRMVTLAQSSPGDRSACAPQSKTATVMLARPEGGGGDMTGIQTRGMGSSPQILGPDGIPAKPAAVAPAEASPAPAECVAGR